MLEARKYILKIHILAKKYIEIKIFFNETIACDRIHL